MINTIKNAIAKRREEGEENDKGFTLIELLVVVLIIGILAAIAIPAFLSQREGAWVGSVESDLKNASLAAETYLVAEGDYDGFDPNSTDRAVNGGFNPSDGVEVDFVHTAGANVYTITGEHDQVEGRTFTFSSTTGTITEND